MQRIVPFLSLTGEGDELELRSVAQDTVGTLADAVGKDTFMPFYEPLFKIALEALNVPNAPRLKECSYNFFSALARVYGYVEESSSFTATVTYNDLASQRGVCGLPSYDYAYPPRSG
jgi:hypothetical protein